MDAAGRHSRQTAVSLSVGVSDGVRHIRRVRSISYYYPTNIRARFCATFRNSEQMILCCSWICWLQSKGNYGSGWGRDGRTWSQTHSEFSLSAYTFLIVGGAVFLTKPHVAQHLHFSTTILLRTKLGAWHYLPTDLRVNSRACHRRFRQSLKDYSAVLTPPSPRFKMRLRNPLKYLSYCSVQIGATAIYRVAQKSKPLPNYQKNRIKDRQLD